MFKQKALGCSPISHINLEIILSRIHEIFQIISSAMLELMSLEIHIISQLKKNIYICNTNSPIKQIQLLYGGSLNYVFMFHEVITC